MGYKNPPLLIMIVCHHSASLVQPIGYPQDGFFYLTLMMDSYSAIPFVNLVKYALKSCLIPTLFPYKWRLLSSYFFDILSKELEPKSCPTKCRIQTIWHWWYSWKNFSKKLVLKKNQQTTKKHEKLNRMQRDFRLSITNCTDSFLFSFFFAKKWV